MCASQESSVPEIKDICAPLFGVHGFEAVEQHSVVLPRLQLTATPQRHLQNGVSEGRGVETGKLVGVEGGGAETVASEGRRHQLGELLHEQVKRLLVLFSDLL